MVQKAHFGNLTSKSTGQETILTAEVPDGWMLVCEQHYWNGTDESIHEVILEDGSILLNITI